MRELTLYEDYSREDVHDILDPETTFTPQAGTWGLQGIISVPKRQRDFVFFVTFGQKQATHEFDEGISSDGILRWQSQPKHRLEDSTVKALIAHDEDRNTIYLFLRTAMKRENAVVPYTYLGRLKYLLHDHDRERPVYFTWQIMDWALPEYVRERIHLRFEGTAAREPLQVDHVRPLDPLVLVTKPKGLGGRIGVSTIRYSKRPPRDYAEQDARNRQLGLAGEEAVLEHERLTLVADGRPDLAERILHVAKVEGDGAAYDIKSYTPDGEEKFIEVKTTRGNEQSAFYLSAAELRFATEHAGQYYLYRVFEFDQNNSSGKLFIHQGDLATTFSLMPVQFKAIPTGCEHER
jgi:Domain of unknown function (DUF3883)/Domain of unknown function (DUF3427)